MVRDYFKMRSTLPIVGVIPAAGTASRLQPLPCSKELYPIGFEKSSERMSHPKVAATYLVEQMASGGAEQLYFILRKGKWDIPAYFGDGGQFDLSIAYLIMGLPHGAPFSADQAYAFVKDKLVLFGFPDILLNAPHAFEKLVQMQKETGAAVVLGIFETDNPGKWDAVELQTDGSIKRVHPKPHENSSGHAWAFACWSPEFTAFMHSHLRQAIERPESITSELSIGHVLQAALKSGLKVSSVLFERNCCLDVGTPEDLKKAILKYS